MSFLSQDDIDIGGRGATTAPPTPRRQISEPPQPPSNSIQPTPTAVNGPVKCIWCDEEFESANGLETSSGDALRDHMWNNHPNVAKFSLLEKDASEETPALESGLEDSEQVLQYDSVARERETLEVERRLTRFWNLHDVNKFAPDYDGEESGLPAMWENVFGDRKPPKPYESEIASDEKFLTVTDPEAYLSLLRDPDARTNDELYAITAYAAHALRVWQDEYLAIDKLSKLATRQVLKKTADPRKLEDPVVFEDKKEAALYGYKYDPKEQKIGNQDPWIQGGFKPTMGQLKKMIDKADDPANPDGWTPIVRNGVKYIPGIRQPQKPAPKRKAIDISTIADIGAAGETENEGERRSKRKTRFGGIKYPRTGETSQTQTASVSPAPVRVKQPMSRATSATPRYTTPAPIPIPSLLTTNKPIHGRKPAAAATAPVSPAPSSHEAGGPPATYDDPLKDPKNIMKIQQSKNPKRTEAMILHWAKFNAEGRTRNPKRTKAQIEADKAVEDTRSESSAKRTKKSKYDIDAEPGAAGPVPAPAPPILPEASNQPQPQLPPQPQPQPQHPPPMPLYDPRAYGHIPPHHPPHAPHPSQLAPPPHPY